MVNNLTISNDEKTFLIYIQWDSGMTKEIKEKVISIALQAVGLWRVDDESENKIKEQRANEGSRPAI